jgi:hypothetical protein
VPASTFGRPGEGAVGAYVSEPLGGGSKARKKSPGTVWQYGGKNPEVKVELHTLPGDALTAIDNHARDLRSKLAESLGVVFLDLEALPNESRLSGKALESAKGRQLDRVNYYRSDFGDKFLLPALGMLLRIALSTNLKIDGLETVAKAVEAAGPAWSWHAPPIELVWGAYFQPSGEEEELLARSAKGLKEAGIATTRVLVEKLRSILGIKDVDAYLKTLEEEQVKAVEQEKDMLKAQAEVRAATAPKKASGE